LETAIAKQMCVENSVALDLHTRAKKSGNPPTEKEMQWQSKNHKTNAQKERR
jgi:hypothetical protein